MIRFISLATAAFCFSVIPLFVQAQELVEKSLPLDGEITPNGQQVTLSWSDAKRPRDYFVEIKRRPFGRVGGDTWQSLGTVSAVDFFVDTNVVAGQAYEYQVIRSGSDVVDVGYWLTGVDVELAEFPGTIHLIVDETLFSDLAVHLERLQRDLLGDGWRVQMLRVPRAITGDARQNLEAASRIRIQLQEQMQADPMGRHSVLLLGHIPYLLSGSAAPDGHGKVPHATDLFYADLDGRWSLNRATMEVTNNRLPSDKIEMQIGRVDFAGIGDAGAELAHIRSYLAKSHHWRTGLLPGAREAYGQQGLLRVELNGLRNIVGPDSITVGGHHDVGEEQPWLFGVDFGDFDGRNYLTDYSAQAIFGINFGSGKQKIEGGKNAMKTFLAQPFFPISVGWGGRPAWQLHVMSLGATIGEVHQRTVNNGRAAEPYRESMDYWPTGQYLWQNPVWVNLLGDPTLRPFVVAPVDDLAVDLTSDEIEVSWADNAPDRITYGIYTLSDNGRLNRIAEVPASERRLVLPADNVSEDAIFAIRAKAKSEVYAGSIISWSSAVFATAGASELVAVPEEISVASGQAVKLPDIFQAPQSGVIRSVILPPDSGDLRIVDGHWRYQAEPGFLGTLRVPYSLSDQIRTVAGELTITVN